MRINMLSQRLPPESVTGAPLQALQLSQALIDSGATLRMFTTRPMGSGPIDWSFGDIPVSTIRYPRVHALVPAARLVATAMRAREISNAQVVHGHALSPMVLGYALGRKKHSPPLLVKPSLGGVHKEGELQKLRSLLPGPALRHALNRIDAFAVLDDLIEADLLGVGISPEKLYRVDNGVELDRFRPAEVEEKQVLQKQYSLPTSRIMLYCGQLSPRKGIMELLSGWPRQLAASHGISLAFCGDGPLRAEVERAAIEHPGSFTYLGQQEDSAPAIRMSDALILPSRNESFGNVVVEALASGLPVAATPCGIAQHLIKTGVTGWQIKSTDACTIRATLEQALSETDQWPHMARECRMAARQFGFNRIAERYLEIYKTLPGVDITPSDPR